MKKILARIIWLPLGVILVVFLVANRQMVAVSLDPISTDNPAISSPALPLWVWLAGALLMGFFTGAAAMWVSARDKRVIARAEHRELKALRKELASQQAPATSPASSASSGATATTTIPTLKAEPVTEQ